MNHHAQFPQSIAITGGAGSIGSQLVASLLSWPIARLRVIDSDHGRLSELEKVHGHDQRVSFSHADVRDMDRQVDILRGFDTVIHAAAIKDIVACETGSLHARHVNVQGVRAVIKAGLAGGMRRFLLLSSDKAADPVSVLGRTKRAGELTVLAAHEHLGSGVIFSVIRLGNVAGSSGSFIPLFRNQLKDGRPLTITDVGMTRFILTIDDAIGAIRASLRVPTGGEILVPRMNIVKVIDVAAEIASEAGIPGREERGVPMRVIGLRPGEKVHESLISESEAPTAGLRDRFIVVTRQAGALSRRLPDSIPVRSDQGPFMGPPDIRKLLAVTAARPGAP